MSEEAEVKISVESRKLKADNSIKTPSDSLFRTHGYSLVLQPNDALYEWAGRTTGFQVTLHLYSCQNARELPPADETSFSREFEEASIEGEPVIMYQYQENIAEHTWCLSLIWPTDAKYKQFPWAKKTFCFRMDIFRRTSDTQFTKFMSVASSTFSIYSKPDVYFNQVKKGKKKKTTPAKQKSTQVKASTSTSTSSRKRKLSDITSELAPKQSPPKSLKVEKATTKTKQETAEQPQKKRKKNTFYNEDDAPDMIDILSQPEPTSDFEYFSLSQDPLNISGQSSFQPLSTPPLLFSSQEKNPASQGSPSSKKPFLISPTGQYMSQSSQNNNGSQNSSTIFSFNVSQNNPDDVVQFHPSNIMASGNASLEPDFDGNGTAVGVRIQGRDISSIFEDSFSQDIDDHGILTKVGTLPEHDVLTGKNVDDPFFLFCTSQETSSYNK